MLNSTLIAFDGSTMPSTPYENLFPRLFGTEAAEAIRTMPCGKAKENCGKFSSA